jgi:hypothetical protein
VTNVNEAPSIISSNAASVPEHTTALLTVTATDPDSPAQTISFSIAGGADAARFQINATTGALSFVTAPDFNAPSDVGADNIYNVTVKATDNGAPSQSGTQDLTVHVTKVNEPPVISGGSSSVTFIKSHGKNPGSGPVKLMPNITIATPQGSTSLGKVVISYFIQKGGAATDVTLADPSSLGSIVDSLPSVKKAGGLRTLTITLDAGVTAAEVQTFLRSISFKTTKFDPAKGTLGRKIDVQVIDRQGQGTPSNKVTTTILAKSK